MLARRPAENSAACQSTRSPREGRRCSRAWAVGGWLNRAPAGNDAWSTRCSWAGSDAGWLMWLLEVQVNNDPAVEYPTGRPRLAIRRLSLSLGAAVRGEQTRSRRLYLRRHESCKVAVSRGTSGPGAREPGRGRVGAPGARL